MKKIQIVIAIIILGISNYTCKSRDSNADFKVGDSCRVKSFCFTAETDSLYNRINDLANTKRGYSACNAMIETCTVFFVDDSYQYKVISIGKDFSKIEYIDMYGKKHIVKVKTDNLTKSNGTLCNKYSNPVRITRDSLKTIERCMAGSCNTKILGKFKMNMFKSEYNKIYNQCKARGTIYQWASSGEMAYTLKSSDGSIEINLCPKFRNNRLIELRGICWNLDGGIPAIEPYFKNKYGSVYYQNGHNYYWILHGFEVLLRTEVVSNAPYSEEKTEVFYIKQLK